MLLYGTSILNKDQEGRGIFCISGRLRVVYWKLSLFTEFLPMKVSSLFYGIAFGWSKFRSGLPFLIGLLLRLGRILTIDNLCCNKVCVIKWCYMCKKAGKTVGHLFLYCDYATEMYLSKKIMLLRCGSLFSVSLSLAVLPTNFSFTLLALIDCCSFS